MIITIDGKRGTGKSRLASSLRATFGCQVVDVGCLFRFIAFLVETGLADSPAEASRKTNHLYKHGFLRILTDRGGKLSATSLEFGGSEILGELWTPSIDNRLRAIAENLEVVSHMRELVEVLTKNGRSVVVGRDTARQFCPTAALKIYLTADEGVRLKRKMSQLAPSFSDEILESTDIEISEPRIGSWSESDPSAMIVDTTILSPGEVIEKAEQEIVGRLNWRMHKVLASINTVRVDLSELQRRIKDWQLENFPGCEVWELALGVSEESGEIADCVLKIERGIRRDEYPAERLRDAIGDLMVYACGICSHFDWDFTDVVEETATKVLKRRWKNEE